MNPRDFLLVAEDLLEATREADWRSAASRAYYAAYLVAVDLVRESGFEVPPDQNGHEHVYRRLNNCGRGEVVEAAERLRRLRTSRNLADYNVRQPFPLRVSVDRVDDAREVIRLLDDLADSEAVLAQVVEAMRVYERDVLKQVTFREPHGAK